jgi:peptide/nickel transport system ATP-binding protein
MTNADATPLLQVKISTNISNPQGILPQDGRQRCAVDDVSFFINEGETLGLVGESGCGKTTTSRCILRAMPPTSGEMLFRTKEGQTVDLAKLNRGELRPLRPQMQMIFQDPYGSLNPRMTLFDIVGEPLLVNGMANRKEREERVAELLRLVGMRPEYMQRFPTAFSGASASASASRGRCRSIRASSSQTSRCLRSTCRCRRRF